MSAAVTGYDRVRTSGHSSLAKPQSWANGWLLEQTPLLVPAPSLLMATRGCGGTLPSDLPSRVCQDRGMAADVPTILATTMGFHRGGRWWSPGPVFDLAFELAGSPARPRLCLLATASGDNPASVAGFYGAFSGGDHSVRVSHLALFNMPSVVDTAKHLLHQDVIWVDRGSLVNLVAVWCAHRLDEVLRECWQAGVVLAGESAGSMCWHASGTTDSFGPRPQPARGLAFVPYANAVHYEQRRTSFHALMGDSDQPSVGYATDAGAGLVYRGTELVEAVADRTKAGAYRVDRTLDGVRETPLRVRQLVR